MDDALDYAGQGAALGKTVGDDFREGKVTLPVLLAFHAADPDERAFWVRTIETGEQVDSDLEQAVALMARQGAIAATLDRAAEFAGRAKAALSVFADSPIKQTLAAVADYTVSRIS